MNIQTFINPGQGGVIRQKCKTSFLPEQHKNPDFLIREKEFTLKTNFNQKEKYEAYRLRHKVFCEELRWVKRSPNGFEIDSYDKYAVPIGIFDRENNLIAFIRLLHSDSAFMLEKEFSVLVKNTVIKKTPDTAETTRFCVASEFRNCLISKDFPFHSFALLLIKGLYHYCLQNNIKFFYTIISYQLYKLLRIMGIISQVIGEPVIMPDGVKTIAIIIDWKNVEMYNSVHRPEMLKWFTRTEYNPSQSPRQQPVHVSQHQVFA